MKLEVLPLFHLVKYKTAIFMYKVFYNLFPANIYHTSLIFSMSIRQDNIKIYMFIMQEQDISKCVLNIWV